MQAPMQRPSGCRALLPTGAGPLLTGSSDGAVRLWDASRPEASYMVCGLPQIAATDLLGASAGPGSGRAQAGQHMPAQATVPVSYAYTHKTIQGIEVVEESCISRIAESPVSLHGSGSYARIALLFCIYAFSGTHSVWLHGQKFICWQWAEIYQLCVSRQDAVSHGALAKQDSCQCGPALEADMREAPPCLPEVCVRAVALGA